MDADVTLRRNKLGLALSGGGFRASLFHLGVLYRMAELDMLRYVEVLSTVSGGSIIGALYTLHLKKQIEAESSRDLTYQQYVEVVEDVRRDLVAGIRRNLRTRLLMNPLGIIRVLLTDHSLGKRMARLYERHVYRDVVAQLAPHRRAGRWLRPGQLPLKELRVRPGGKDPEGGIEGYNARAVTDGRSVSTRLVLNATSLNSGARFWFASSEIGDWYTGHVRRSELKRLLKQKVLLDAYSADQLQSVFDSVPSPEQPRIGDSTYSRRTVSLALWWLRRTAESVKVPEGWEPLFAFEGFPGQMADTDFGRLRQAEHPAWYLREGKDRGINGGLDADQHMARFWNALRRFDPDLVDQLYEPVTADPILRDLLLDFVLELYRLRTAQVVSTGIERDWERLTVGEAVGASACFPPVFPPYLMLGLYDDRHVSRLGLTDGGVYDNVGITALRDELCNYIIASDTSGVFGLEKESVTGRLGLGGRVIGILMKVVASFQRDALREQRRVSRAGGEVVDAATNLDRGLLPSQLEAPLTGLSEHLAGRELRGLAFFHIGSAAVVPEDGAGRSVVPVDREALARIRTDLDGFGDVEIAALANHGYDTADRYIRKYFADSPYQYQNEHWAPTTRPLVDMSTVDATKADRIIRVGRSRFFRALRLGAPLSWFAVLASAGVAAWRTWELRLSVGEVVTGMSRWFLGWLESTLWLFGTGWTEWAFPVGRVLLGLLVIGAIAWLVKPTLGRKATSLRKGLKAKSLRNLMTAAKWIRAFSPNLVWLFSWIPVLLALIVSAAAWISHLLFHKPFLRATRLGEGLPLGPWLPRENRNT